MKNIEILQLTEEEIRKNYNLEDADLVGHSVTEKMATFTFEDSDIKLKISYKFKDALRVLFFSRKEKGEFENSTFEEFEELYNEGFKLEDIDEELKSRKLNFK